MHSVRISSEPQRDAQSLSPRILHDSGRITNILERNRDRHGLQDRTLDNPRRSVALFSPKRGIGEREEGAGYPENPLMRVRVFPRRNSRIRSGQCDVRVIFRGASSICSGRFKPHCLKIRVMQEITAAVLQLRVKVLVDRVRRHLDHVAPPHWQETLSWRFSRCR
jgi:hypothetical protein